MVSAQDLLNIARTTLSSKILTHDKDHFAELAVDAVLRLKGSTNLEAIQIIKKPGGTLRVRLHAFCSQSQMYIRIQCEGRFLGSYDLGD